MSGISQHPITTRLFITTVVIGGGAALTSSLYTLYKEPIPHEWMFLAALTLLSFLLAIKVPGVPAKISVSETFVFASVLLFGTAAATVTVALDALIMSGWQRRREPLKVLFNTTEPTLSIWLASNLFYLMVGEPLRSNPRDATTLAFPVVVLSLSYLLLNSCLTAAAISLQSGRNAVLILRGHFFWIALNYLGGASAALLIVQNSTTLNTTTVTITLPLLVITYLTFKSSMGRIEDANAHVEHLNQMYMSTIETLAMAVDAKDQTTHGHIRRVQTHAVALANALGIDDVDLIRAIEAAALLHDIGKLGVPEHILNKPGTLNSAEFERMKTHAALGAEILSATEFPYPVVPIVRHHHENWDGSGYPDGLAGVDIPLGARLLAVVDCFDALISDRPYRPRMSRSEALDVLNQRRGRMYDPLVVDTFTRVVDNIIVPDSSEIHELFPVKYDRTAMPRDVATTSHSAESCRRSGQVIDDAFRALSIGIPNYLEGFVPDSVYILFRCHDKLRELVPVHMSSDISAAVTTLRIPFSQQLSGWVAANRETVVNSNSGLDLRDLSVQLSLRHAICTPIACGTIVFGVLSIYRRSEQLFSIEETAYVESLSRSISAKLSESIAHPRESVRIGDTILRAT